MSNQKQVDANAVVLSINKAGNALINKINEFSDVLIGELVRLRQENEELKKKIEESKK
jgi:hypothetical protein